MDITPQPSSLEKSMTRLLALIPGGIGDQLLCFPMLESLQAQYPDAQIDVVVEPRAKAAYRVSRVVKQILAYNFQGRNGPADWGNFIGWVREREYAAVVAVGTDRFTGLLIWLTGITKRVGYAGTPAALFMTDTVVAKPQQYAADFYHDLLQGMGQSSPCPELAINVPRSDIEWAEAELQRLEVQGDRGYLVVHCGSVADHEATGDAGIYPVAAWQSLIQGIQERQPDVPIVLIQSPSETQWFGPLQNACPGLKVVLPEDLGKVAAVVAGANLMICPDCDAMHLGVAVKTYLVTLFGKTDPARVLPQDERFVTLRSPTGKVADIAPIQILEKIWGK